MNEWKSMTESPANRKGPFLICDSIGFLWFSYWSESVGWERWSEHRKRWIKFGPENSDWFMSYWLALPERPDKRLLPIMGFHSGR